MSHHPHHKAIALLLAALLAVLLPAAPERALAEAAMPAASDGLMPFLSDGVAGERGGAFSDGMASGGHMESSAMAEADTVFVPGYLGDKAPAPALRTADGPALLGESLPEKYDLRNVNGTSYMTAPRRQYNYGTCWAFSVIASAESNMLKKGMGAYDLSEMHLVNYTYNRNAQTAQAGGMAGDVVSHMANAEADVLMYGGLAEEAVTALSCWLGPIPESALPYNLDSSAQAVRNGSLDLAYAYSKNTAHLDYAYEINIRSDPDAVKRLLMESGAASISHWAGADYHDTTYHSYYVPQTAGTNHAVTLCGWDDTFPREHFASAAPADGAWICKNSYGPAWGENGYFYISYYDGSIQNACFIGMAAVDDYTSIYQHDGGVFTETVTIGYGEAAGYAANRFRAARRESLEAVRVQMRNPGARLHIRIYKGGTGFGEDGQADPIYGALHCVEADTEAVCPYAGVYTIPLAAPVSLNENDVFSIVIHMESGDVQSPLLLCYDSPKLSGDRQSLAAAAAGQSYSSVDGESWVDTGAPDGGYNLRIKALAGDPAYTPTGIFGDVDANGVFSLRDVVATARYAVGMGTFIGGAHGAQFQVADVLADGKIDIRDVQMLCAKLVGL